jgi:hypothetical protein
MAYQKLQAGSAIPVVPSDTISIPAGDGVQLSSQTTGAALNKLVDTTQAFTTTVKVGAIVHNITDGAIATVTAIDGNTELTLSADIMAISKDYTIYAGPETNGCVLYVGTSGDLKVKMASGKDITFNSIPAGFQPIQVLKVYETGTSADNIIALW